MPHVQKRKVSDTITQTVEVIFSFNLINSKLIGSFDKYSQQSSQHRPHKKLRITIKRSTSNAGPSTQVLSSLLENSTNSNESLQILTQISDTLGNIPLEDMLDLIRKLSEHFKREKESAVRVKVSDITYCH